jgi:pyrimidine/purine-5'-nucleotide nucleosidase
MQNSNNTSSIIIPEIQVPAADYLQYLRESEISHLVNGASDDLRRCALGIAHTGQSTDDTEKLFEMYPNFGIEITRVRQGVSFILKNVPKPCFIEREGQLECKENIRQHLSAVVRDLLYSTITIGEKQKPGEEITDAIFYILKNAGFFSGKMRQNGKELDRRRVFAWGGHSINNNEYDYSKNVGTQLAYQFLEIITGGGPGIMRGAPSGALAGYQAEYVDFTRQFGFNCPSIITSEPPNNIINSLITLPDIEKRLEAFIRGSLGGIVFPGGPGTAEEILTMISILLHPKNSSTQCPLVFTAPEESKSYFVAIDNFLKKVFGDSLTDKSNPMYEIIIGNPELAAQTLAKQCKITTDVRAALQKDTIDWDSSMHVPSEIQEPFEPTHENVAKLNLSRDQDLHILAAELRKLFSAIVYGNVSDKGIAMIREKGPFQITGYKEIIDELDTLLRIFVSEGRMKIEGEYNPCYELHAA